MMPRPAILIVAIVGIAVAALMVGNITADESALVDAAKQAACGGAACSAALTMEERSAFSHRYQFRIDARGTVGVACSPSLWLVGSQSCAVTAP